MASPRVPLHVLRSEVRRLTVSRNERISSPACPITCRPPTVVRIQGAAFVVVGSLLLFFVVVVVVCLFVYFYKSALLHCIFTCDVEFRLCKLTT